MTDRHEIAKRLLEIASSHRETPFGDVMRYSKNMIALLNEAATLLESSPLLPEGWVAVPRGPTEEILERMARALCDADIKNRYVTVEQRAVLIDENWRVLVPRARAMYDAVLSAAPPPPSPWRPIAEAPRDGTRILTSARGASDGASPVIVRWGCGDMDTPTWRYSRTQHCGLDLTHWMPLPPAPEVGEA